MRRKTRGGKAFLFILGFVFVCAGVGFFVQENSLKNECTAQTAGVVRDFVSETRSTRSSGGQARRTVVYYHPLVAYTADGVEYVEKSHVGGDKRYAVGQRVTVFYDPSDPKRFYVLEDASDSSAAPMILVGVGVVLMTIGVAMFFRGRSRTPQEL